MRTEERQPLNARQTSLSDYEPLELVRSHMPKWLLDARPQIIDGLNAAMALSREYHELIGKRFGELQSVESYCTPLLTAELLHRFGPGLDVNRDHWAMVHVHVIADDTLLVPLSNYLQRDELKTLLWAALQNFSEDEATEGGISRASGVLQGTGQQHRSQIEPYQFAAACRSADLGGKYQRYLQAFLGVAPSGSAIHTAEQSSTHDKLRLLKIYDMQVDAHVAFLKKDISESAFKALSALLVAQPVVATAQVQLDGKTMVQSSLSVLDTTIDGVLLFSADDILLHPGNRLIAYIPNDPVAPFREYNSLPAFTGELLFRLGEPQYLDFFLRFMSLAARAGFFPRVEARPEHLLLTTQAMAMSAGQYLATVQLKNMFADARVMAVPTGVLDAAVREQRWQFYKSAGLSLLKVAALFVPVLGELMLAVAAARMLEEVFEGVKDWSRGDIDHAREHLLNVAKDIATTTVMVVGAGVVKSVASKLSAATESYFTQFEPVSRDDGIARLWNRQLAHYESSPLPGQGLAPDAEGFFESHGRLQVEVDRKRYNVAFDERVKQWRIVHPRRAEAFRPALLHNREGAWQHAHERPLEWQGSSTLMSRLGTPTASLEPPLLERVQALTGTTDNVLRRVHLDNLAPPALLKVSLKRFQIDQQITDFVTQMMGSDYGASNLADLQLTLLPLLPDWPAHIHLSVLDGAGRSTARFGQGQTSIYVHQSEIGQPRLLETIAGHLTRSQLRTLIGNDVPLRPLPVQVLAKKIGTYARNHRAQVFDLLFERYNVSVAPEAQALERVFPGLPRTVTQSMVDAAHDEHRLSLRANKVPLEMAEQARVHLRDIRLNRAFEGFYLPALATTDTEKLAQHFVTQLPGWPARSVLAKEPSQSVFESLTPSQRRALGYPSLSDADVFNEVLATRVIGNRDEAARVLGMQPIKPGFKAPARTAEGHLGYPLCGLDTSGHSVALMRRVKEIYPEFDFDEVDYYLDILLSRGLDPLTSLRRLKHERRALFASLQSWINATAAEMSLADTVHNFPENRYQMARLIERSWRMSPNNLPWATSEETHTLNLSGMRVGTFPVLPDHLSFAHVQELKLGNMNCRHTAERFLQHFTNLTALEMDNNHMVHLPRQLLQMPFLQRLSLSYNLLYMNPGNINVLANLGNLEVLNLNGNLLGSMLDLSMLPKLRRVSLRRTGLEEWPRGLLTRPLLEIADLRENSIVEVPEQVYQAPVSLTFNISLSGNPLSAASRLRLARSVMQGGSSMGINSEELMGEAAAFDFWTAGITRLELDRRVQLWNRLRADPMSEDFFMIITRLTTTADAQSVRQDLSRRVWEMIEAANESSPLRQDLLDVAAAPRSCTDSVAMAFSALEVQIQLSRIVRGSPTQHGELLALAKGLFRLDQVEKIAADHYRALVAQGGPTPDELEVHLAYRIGLSRTLGLPSQPENMHFKVLGGVSEVDLQSARLLVEVAEKSMQLPAFVSSRDFWRDYLIKKNKVEFSALTDHYYVTLSELLRKSPDMSSERYLSEVAQVRSEMEAAINHWSLEKTQAILPPQPPAIGQNPGSFTARV